MIQVFANNNVNQKVHRGETSFDRTLRSCGNDRRTAFVAFLAKLGPADLSPVEARRIQIDFESLFGADFFIGFPIGLYLLWEDLNRLFNRKVFKGFGRRFSTGRRLAPLISDLLLLGRLLGFLLKPQSERDLLGVDALALAAKKAPLEPVNLGPQKIDCRAQLSDGRRELVVLFAQGFEFAL